MTARSRTSRIVADVAEAIGQSSALELVARMGGRDLYVPRRVPDHHVIIRAIGAEAADALAAHYGGDTLRLPAPANAFIEHRNAAIVRCRRRGWLLREIAAEFGITARQARNIIAQYCPCGTPRGGG